MSELKNISINELPFQESLRDTDIIHISDGQDKQSTLARLWEWTKEKIGFTNTVHLKTILLATSDKKLERIPLEEFQQTAFGGLMNALAPLQIETLINAGFSELEIFVYRVARKSALREVGEYFYMDIKDDGLLYEFVNSSFAHDYLLTYGISLANGENGSRDARGVFLRAVDAGAGRESEERQMGQLQRDAFQGFLMGTYYDDSGKVDTPYVIQSTTRNRHTTTSLHTNVTCPEGLRTQILRPNQVFKPIINDGENGDPRLASETRPQNITALLFQKVGDILWQDIPSFPPHLIKEEEY